MIFIDVNGDVFYIVMIVCYIVMEFVIFEFFNVFFFCIFFVIFFIYIWYIYWCWWCYFVVWVVIVFVIYWYGWNVDRFLKYDFEKWIIFRVYSLEIIMSIGEISCFRLKIFVMVYIGMNFSIWVWRVGCLFYFFLFFIIWKILILYFLNFIF